MATDECGVVGVAVSIGIVCDGPQALPEPISHVYTRGKGVFWPPENFHDFRPLPEVWVGSMSAAGRPLRDIPVRAAPKLAPLPGKQHSLGKSGLLRMPNIRT